MQKSLLGLRAAALMGVRTHRLISLSDRLTSSPMGHQIQGASIDPFHADPQSRTRSRWWLDRRNLDVGVESLVVAQHTPGYTREFVGQCDGEFVPCNRSEAAVSHAPKLYRAQLCGRIKSTFAAWINSVRG
jgi:hypothetical protein